MKDETELFNSERQRNLNWLKEKIPLASIYVLPTNTKLSIVCSIRTLIFVRSKVTEKCIDMNFYGIS